MGKKKGWEPWGRQQKSQLLIALSLYLVTENLKGESSRDFPILRLWKIVKIIQIFK